MECAKFLGMRLYFVNGLQILAVFFAERFANDIYKRLKPYLTTAKANAAKTGSFNPNILEKGLSEMQKIFDGLEI